MLQKNKIVFIIIMILAVNCGGVSTRTVYTQQLTKNHKNSTPTIPIMFEELIEFLMERGYFQYSFEKIGIYNRDIDTDHLLGLYVLMGYTITPIVDRYGNIQFYIAQLQSPETYMVNNQLGVFYKLRDNIRKNYNIENL